MAALAGICSCLDWSISDLFEIGLARRFHCRFPSCLAEVVAIVSLDCCNLYSGRLSSWKAGRQNPAIN